MDRLGRQYELIKSEYQVVKRKLQSKCEALLILSQELDQCRSERDQFRLMADQLRSRYQTLKRQTSGLDIEVSSLDDVHNSYTCNQLEVDQLKQKLQDAQGDIKLLREQIGRQRVGTSDEGMNTRHFPAHEREDLVRQLEASSIEYLQMERDLQQVLDEKEESVTERDVYKNKYERLNTELNYILKGDEKRIVDVDALSMENKYLQERLKQMEEEKSMAMATLSKYKHILERKKNKGILKFGQSRSGGVVITQKQVEQLVQNRTSLSPSQQTMTDLQTLAGALLDTVNDKNLALSHQRKTNKLLGSRVSELEKKLKTLEVAGLWNMSFTDKMSSNDGEPCLQDLQKECLDLKALTTECGLESLSAPESFGSVESSPEKVLSPQSSMQGSSLDMDELDLLPTRESSCLVSGIPAIPCAANAEQGELEAAVNNSEHHIYGFHSNGQQEHVNNDSWSNDVIDGDPTEHDEKPFSQDSESFDTNSDCSETCLLKSVSESQGFHSDDLTDCHHDETSHGDESLSCQSDELLGFHDNESHHSKDNELPGDEEDMIEQMSDLLNCAADSLCSKEACNQDGDQDGGHSA